MYCSNKVGSHEQVLTPGIYGLSNAELDCPWRKVVYGREHFTTIVSRVTPSLPKEDLTEELLQLLGDTTWYNLPVMCIDVSSKINLGVQSRHAIGMYGNITS